MSQATYKELAKVVRDVGAKAGSSKDAAKSIAAYLVNERRTGETDRIMREVERLQAQDDGIVEVTASSARPLSEGVKQQIGTLFGEQQVRIIEKQDASLVGGVHIKSLDTQLDLSVRGQLKGLKNSLKG